MMRHEKPRTDKGRTDGTFESDTDILCKAKGEATLAVLAFDQRYGDATSCYGQGLDWREFIRRTTLNIVPVPCTNKEKLECALATREVTGDVSGYVPLFISLSRYTTIIGEQSMSHACNVASQ